MTSSSVACRVGRQQPQQQQQAAAAGIGQGGLGPLTQAYSWPVAGQRPISWPVYHLSQQTALHGLSAAGQQQVGPEALKAAGPTWKASTSCTGRSEMKPTVSLRITSLPLGSMMRRRVGSRVANSWSAAPTSDPERAVTKEDLPAFV